MSDLALYRLSNSPAAALMQSEMSAAGGWICAPSGYFGSLLFKVLINKCDHANDMVTIIHAEDKQLGMLALIFSLKHCC